MVVENAYVCSVSISQLVGTLQYARGGFLAARLLDYLTNKKMPMF